VANTLMSQKTKVTSGTLLRCKTSFISEFAAPHAQINRAATSINPSVNRRVAAEYNEPRDETVHFNGS
jgi:hypothetical protein